MKEFPLNSRHPGPRREEGGVASCGPHATSTGSAGSGGSAGSAGEFREVIFYTQAQYFRHICSELGVHFLTNARKSPWAPQGIRKAPQGTPKGTLIFHTPCSCAFFIRLYHTPFSYAFFMCLFHTPFSYAFFIRLLHHLHHDQGHDEDIFRRYNSSVVLESVHGQQPKPIV